MRDLEIRGAGNLLGAEQSGHIGAVGFTLFTQLLAIAVEQVRAERSGKRPAPPRRGPVVSVDLPIPRLIPTGYIDDLAIRVGFYQRLSEVETVEQVGEIADELRDRFGPLPADAVHLLDSLRLRCLAARIGAASVQHEDDSVVVRLIDGISFSEAHRRLPVAPTINIGRRLLRYRPPTTQPLHRTLRDPNWHNDLTDALNAVANA